MYTIFPCLSFELQKRFHALPTAISSPSASRECVSETWEHGWGLSGVAHDIRLFPASWGLLKHVFDNEAQTACGQNIEEGKFEVCPPLQDPYFIA